MGDFSEAAFVKIVAVNGNFKYGYIQKVQEKGYHLLLCLHEEGISAFEYELASGTMAEEWDKMLTDIEKKIIALLAQGLSTKEVAQFLDSVKTIVSQSIVSYQSMEFTNLLVSFGCTGGQHRSVYCAEKLNEFIKKKFQVETDLFHKELN